MTSVHLFFVKSPANSIQRQCHWLDYKVHITADLLLGHDVHVTADLLLDHDVHVTADLLLDHDSHVRVTADLLLGHEVHITADLMIFREINAQLCISILFYDSFLTKSNKKKYLSTVPRLFTSNRLNCFLFFT